MAIFGGAELVLVGGHFGGCVVVNGFCLFARLCENAPACGLDYFGRVERERNGGGGGFPLLVFFFL